jgi:hypothetical protein
VRLSGARIHGTFSLAGATLSGPERDSLIAARGATVDGDLELDNLRASGGTLRFSNTTLSSVVAVGAQLSNPGGVTLSLHQATVRGSVVLSRGFTSAGLIVLTRSTLTGRLECDRGWFDCPAPHEGNEQGHAIEAVSASVRGGMDLSWTRASPSVDLTNASTTFLADDPASWPDRILISGFTYDRFEPSRRADPAGAWDHRTRSAWLARQAVYDAGPYEQAARVFRQHGYTSAAESILIAQRAQARQLIGGRGAGLRRGVDGVFGATVAYGYRPGRVAGCWPCCSSWSSVPWRSPRPRPRCAPPTPPGWCTPPAGPLSPQGPAMPPPPTSTVAARCAASAPSCSPSTR